VDVSADGDPLTGFDVYDNFNYCEEDAECYEEVQDEIERYGGWETFGGTSVGTPLIASLYALVGGANGTSYPALTLYGHLGDSASLYDVTEGSNGFCDGEPSFYCGRPNVESGYVLDCEGTSACNAGSGYDGPSGVGTPNGLEAFTPLFPTAVITPPESARAEVPASFNGRRSTDPYPGGSVTGYSWSWGDGTAESAGIAPTHTYLTPGEYTVTLTVTDNYGLVGIPVSEPVTVLARTAKELEELAAKKKAEEELSARRAEETKQKATEEAARKAEEKKAEEKKAEEEGAAHTAAVKRQEEEAAAVAARKLQQEEAARIQVLGIKEGSPDATLASTPLRASVTGVVVVRISCPAADTKCAGTVTLRTLGAVSADLAGAAARKPAIVTLGTGSFSLAGGKVAAVTLHLSAKVRALLERSHELRVRLTILARNPEGATHTSHAVTTLIAPKHTH
jgi:PKD repeat protein